MLNDYRQQFLDYLEAEKRFSPATLRGYGIDLDQFIAFLLERDPELIEKPGEINRTVIRRYLGHLSNEQGRLGL